MNDDKSNYIIQSETSASSENATIKNESIKESIQDISNSLIDKRYIKKHPSAKVITHATKYGN